MCPKANLLNANLPWAVNDFGDRAAQKGPRVIPNVYRFVFGLRRQDEPFHLLHYLCLASCLEVNRPERVVVHCLHQPWGPLWERIRPRIEVAAINPASLPGELPYDDPAIARFSYAHQADFIRLQLLLEHGGVYADMDTLFVRQPEPALFDMPCVMGRECVDVAAAGDNQGSLCNALIMAEPDSEFIRRWLDAMPTAFDGSWSNHSTFLPYRLSQEYPALIHVEPESRFFYLDWTPSGIGDLFERAVALPDDGLSLHLWAHLWWDRERTDFSRFSADQFTAAYVRTAGTTYARLARRFLPPEPLPIRLLQRLRDIAGQMRR